MKDAADGVPVTIVGKDFMIACPAEERQSLLAAAAMLDRKMREIQASGKVIGTERAAIMAALNIAHELLALRERGNLSPDMSQKLRLLQSKIDAALDRDAHPRQ